jgi:hypothetical protein
MVEPKVLCTIYMNINHSKNTDHFNRSKLRNRLSFGTSLSQIFPPSDVFENTTIFDNN